MRSVFHGLSGVNGLIWCSTILVGQWREHTKLCGIFCLTMANLSGNELSITWKKLQTLRIKMFVKKLTRFGVSRVLLLIVAIKWLLGRLGHGWALVS